MSFALGQPVPWTVPPDWTGGVRERLAWLTDVLPSLKGKRQKRALRLAPRRGFEFDVVAEGPERRLVDAALADHAAKVWELPVWPDVQRLAAPVASGADAIACRTAGFDFTAGGRALLWRGINTWELVEVASVEAESLVLAAETVTAQAWPAGTRLYPLRRARLEAWPDERHWHDRAGRLRVSFQIDEPCDWPAVMPAATYRGLPVLEDRPETSQLPVLRHERVVEEIDPGTGIASQTDWPGLDFAHADHAWLLSGRVAQGALRSLLYALDGRRQELWRPTWNADLVLAGTTAAGIKALHVEWCGYTVFGRAQPNRRDIRLQMADGSVVYRRIVASLDLGATEKLTLDEAPGVELTPANVRLISYLVRVEQASDVVEIMHRTDADGTARVVTAFRGVPDDA